MDFSTEEAIRKVLAEVSKRYDVDQAILYGSRARGDHQSDSDADLAILLHGRRERFFSVVSEMADISFDVMLETGVLVEALPIWLDEWNHPELYSNPFLLENIDREGIRL